ncbi:MAG: DUF1508 domain-containing protein [Clostridia bacterium]|nr:DUF1508 domain-containing protein [Clostridia bacterium]
MRKIISSMLIGASFITEPLEAMRNSLVDILGFNIEMWQMILVGILAVALIVVLIVALCRPGKKNKKERIKQFIDTEEKICKIKKALNEKNEEIGKARHVLNKRQLDYSRSVRTVKENYANAYGKEDREFFVTSEKLNELNENLRDLSLRMTKKNIKAEELDALKAEFAEAEAKHSDLAERFAEMRTEKIARDEKYNAELKKLEDDYAFVKDDYEADIDVKTKEIRKLEAELDKLEHTKIKISSREADEILEEFRKQEELEKDARLRLAEDDVEKAKNEYIEAQNLRIQYERDRIEAVNSAREDSAARKQTLEATRAATEARVKYGSPAASDVNDEETEEVKEIIKASDEEKIASEYIDSVIKESETIDDEAERSKPEVTLSATEEASAPETTATLTEKQPDEETALTEEQTEEETTLTGEQTEEETTLAEEQPEDGAANALDLLERGMSMVDEQNREEVVSEVATVEKEAEEIAADTAEPVSEQIAEDTRETESEVAEEVKGDAADETTGEEQTVSENTVSEAEEQPEEIANETNDEETNDETDNEVSAEDLDLVNEAENIEIEDIGEENVSAEDTEKVKTAPEDTEATETAEAAEATEIQAAEESAAAKDEVAITEEPAEEDSEEVKAIASEIAAEENIAASNEDSVDNADNPVNDAKIIRLPKIIHNDGIPATPIHKKSKFSKPVTKIVVKKAPVRDETAEELPAKEEAKKSAYLGKWKTETAEDGKMFAKLCASNGGVLLVTPSYTSDIGLKNGIASIKKHLAAGNVAITANKAGKFVFKVSAPSGRTIVTSEQYGARFQCEKALESAKRFAETAVVTEL